MSEPTTRTETRWEVVFNGIVHQMHSEEDARRMKAQAKKLCPNDPCDARQIDTTITTQETVTVL